MSPRSKSGLRSRQSLLVLHARMFAGCVFAPRLLIFVTELLVEQSGRPFVATIPVKSLGVISYGPVGCLVFDQATVLQSRERSADRALVEADLRGNLAS
jgi:hypothetical protein